MPRRSFFIRESELSDDLDLAECAIGDLSYSYAGTCGLAYKILCVNAVESSKVSHIGKEAGGLHNVIKGKAVSFENTLDVLANLLGLLLNGSANDSSGCGVKRDLAGSVEHAVYRDSLGVGAVGGTQ